MIGIEYGISAEVTSALGVAEALTNIEDHNGIDALLAISVSDSDNLVDEVKSRIEDLKSELVRKRFDSKSEDKKLKLLFDLTHKNFFLKYKEISNFSEIFNAKEYNCVSATALYCLLLEEIDLGDLPLKHRLTTISLNSLSKCLLSLFIYSKFSFMCFTYCPVKCSSSR